MISTDSIFLGGNQKPEKKLSLLCLKGDFLRHVKRRQSTFLTYKRSHRSVPGITDKNFKTDLIYSLGDLPSASISKSNIMLKSPPHMNVVSSAMSS